MRARTLALPIAIGSILLAAGLAGCSSNDEGDTSARQAAAAPPRSGAGICMQNETASTYGGTSENTREQDRDIVIPPGETVCGWWVGASAPKLLLMGPVGPTFEIVRSGNFEITFCDKKLKIPFGETGESEELTMDCYGNQVVVKFVKEKDTYGPTRYIAVVRDA